MIPDPIVEEIRGFRDAIAKAHGYDVGAIFAMFRKLEAESGRVYVTFEPRRCDPTEVPAPDQARAEGDQEG